jgi:CheY-like chemotaxis protein
MSTYLHLALLRLRATSAFTPMLRAGAPASHTHIGSGNIESVTIGRGHRILVVEDNEDVGRYSTELLQDLGYSTRRADNARQALALIDADRSAFDVVFSDVIMPGMNGVELATIIRERHPHLPVILTSGYSSVLAENAPSGVRADSEALFGGSAVARAAPGHHGPADDGLD